MASYDETSTIVNTANYTFANSQNLNGVVFQVVSTGASTKTFDFSIDGITFFEIPILNLDTSALESSTILDEGRWGLNMTALLYLRITQTGGPAVTTDITLRAVQTDGDPFGEGGGGGGTVIGTGTDEHIVIWDGTGVPLIKDSGPIISGGGNVISDVDSVTLRLDSENNTWWGYLATPTTSTGTDNAAFGANAGSSLSLADSNNISIMNVAFAGSNNRTFIGTRGTHDVADFPAYRARPTPSVDNLNQDLILTIAQIRTGILAVTPTAPRTWTLPTASSVIVSLTGAQVNDTFDFYIINEDEGGANDITLADSVSDNPVTGNREVCSAAVTSHSEISSGHFRIRITQLSGPPECITYRLA